MVAVRALVRWLAIILCCSGVCFAQAGGTSTTATTQPQTGAAAQTTPQTPGDSKELRSVGSGVQILNDALVPGAIALLLLLACNGFVIWLLLSERARRREVPAVATPSGVTAADLERLGKNFEARQRKLQSGQASLLAEFRALRELVQQTRSVAVEAHATEELVEEAPKAMAAAAGASEPEIVIAPAPGGRERFEEWYRRVSRDGAADGLQPKPITVSFKNPQALDRNPERFEPLVRNNDGNLMLFPYDELADGEYYAAPLLDFKGQFSETHTRTWRSLFVFKNAKAQRLVKAAVVRMDGNEWTLVKKGEFA